MLGSLGRSKHSASGIAAPAPLSPGPLPAHREPPNSVSYLVLHRQTGSKSFRKWYLTRWCLLYSFRLSPLLSFSSLLQRCAVLPLIALWIPALGLQPPARAWKILLWSNLMAQERTQIKQLPFRHPNKSPGRHQWPYGGVCLPAGQQPGAHTELPTSTLGLYPYVWTASHAPETEGSLQYERGEHRERSLEGTEIMQEAEGNFKTTIIKILRELGNSNLGQEDNKLLETKTWRKWCAP